MEVSVTGQMHVFWAMFLGGAASGMLADIFRLLRLQFGLKRITTSIADLLFWIFVAVGIFMLHFYSNNGEIRWYSIVGVLLGAALYFLTISAVIRKILGWIFAFLSKILLVICKIVLTIFGFLYKIVHSIFMFFARLLGFGNGRLKRGGGRAVRFFKRGFSRCRLVLKKK